MSRVVKLASAGGVSSAAGLSTAAATKLIQDNVEWSLIKRYELTANVAHFNFPGADFDFDNWWGWRIVFMNNYRYQAATPAWQLGQTSNSNVGRNFYNGGIATNNTSTLYVSTQSHPANASWFHTSELYRDSNDHRWQLKWDTGLPATGGYYASAGRGYAVLEGTTPASIRTGGLTMESAYIQPNANGNNYVYLYGSNLTKGAA